MQIEYNPCDINLPHTHPRATELAMVLEGELLMGLVEELGGQVHTYRLREGQAFVFNRGVLHFEYNDNCEPALMYAVLNHHDPGALFIPLQLNMLDEEVLLATYGVNENQLENVILENAPIATPTPGGSRCLDRCAARQRRRDDDDDEDEEMQGRK